MGSGKDRPSDTAKDSAHREMFAQESRQVLHQEGGVTLKKSGRYPAFLAGVLIVTGVITFAYYQSVAPSEEKTVKKKH